MQKEYLSAAAEVLSDQGVDENLGLSNDEASSRLAKTGPNKRTVPQWDDAVCLEKSGISTDDGSAVYRIRFGCARIYSG